MNKKPSYEELEKQIEELKLELNKQKKTGFVKNQKKNKQDEDRFEILSNASFESIFISDKGVCIEANRAACINFGYTYNETIGMFGTDFIADESKEFVKNNMLSGYEKPYDAIAKRKDGTKFYAEFQGRMFEYNGKKIRITAVRDISERKRIETALKESEKKLKSVLDNAKDAIVLHDLNGKMLMINKEFCRRFGYSCEEAMLLTPMDIDTPEYAAKVPGIIEKINKHGTVVFETKHKCKNGDIIPTEVNASLIDLAGKKAILSIGRDISDRKKAEVLMLKASRMEVTTTLAGGIAHDFNNLMVGVLGNAELLKMQYDKDSDIYNKLCIIIDNANMAGELSQQLLAFARGGKYKPEILNLNDNIKETLDLNKRLFPSHIHIERDIEHDLFYVNADSSQMSQILLDFYMNSVDAIEKEGQIIIKTRNVIIDKKFAKSHPPLIEGNHVFLSVEDTGCGMNKEILSKVFEPFFSTKITGRGLGLAAVYGIIENHGGYISVDSKVNSGTKFEIYLPAVEFVGKKRFDIIDQKINKKISAGIETILIIDDEKTVLDVTGRILEKYGYRTLSASNGQEALEIINDFNCDIHLTILDMGMPVLGGSKTFPLLKKSCPDMKVIICSGYELDSEAQLLLDAGANSFLQKPFGLKKLLQEVRDVLEII